MNNAYKMMQATDTEFNEITCSISEGCQSCCFDTNFGNNFKILARYFKASKTCFSNNARVCWECDKGQSAKYMTSAPDYLGCTNESYAFIDHSGRAWYMYSNRELEFLVDTNGFVGPNQIGKDRWRFYLPSPRHASTNKGMIMPASSINVSQKDRLCPSGDCKYGKIFFNK